MWSWRCNFCSTQLLQYCELMYTVSELRRIFEFCQFHNISCKNISSKRLRIKIRKKYFLRYDFNPLHYNLMSYGRRFLDFQFQPLGVQAESFFLSSEITLSNLCMSFLWKNRNSTRNLFLIGIVQNND